MPKIGVPKRRRRFRPDNEKLAQLILLISERSEDDPTFGSVKLNKLLFHCDFSAYLTFGVPITGQEYFALPQGPAPRRLIPVTKRLQMRGEFGYKEIDFYGKTQKKPMALSRPNISVFTSREINLIDKIIHKYWGMTGREISEGSHLFIGWRIAKEQETIPYTTALVGFRKPTTEEVAYGLQLETLAKGCLSHASAQT
jgi:hypothetical protein